MKSFIAMFVPLVLLGSACEYKKETAALTRVEGTVIGPGCLTGSYAIQLAGKNSEYGIQETVSYDNVVETLNLPDAYKVNGTQIYFTFTQPTVQLGKYLTYCTPAPQVTLHRVGSKHHSLQTSR